MKKNLNLSALAVIAAALTINTSCSNDELVRELPNVREPVVFNVGVSSAPMTRAAAWATNQTVGDQWANGVVVSIYTTTNAAQDAYATYDYHTTAVDNDNTTTLSPVSSLFYWASSNEKTTAGKTVRAWSYGNSTTPAATYYNTSNTTLFTLTGTGGTAQTNHELLYGYQTGFISTNTLTLKHQLAKLIIKVWTRKYLAPTAFTIGDNSSNKIQISNTFTPPSTAGQNGTWTALTHTADGSIVVGYITPQTDLSAASSDGTNANYKAAAGTNVEADEDFAYVSSYEAIILPGNYFSKKLFFITYDGAVYAYTTPGNQAFAAGYVYTYNLKVTDSAIESAEVTITPWADGGTSNGSAELQ